MDPLLAVAALSARMLAEVARGSGFRTVALDLFGDRDTRRAAEAWFPIGETARLVIDCEALTDALRRSREAGAEAWVAGSGFDGCPELLAAGAEVLPLAGNTAEVVARVRNPALFFGRLAALGIPHPETRCDCPPSPLGWLRKNAASSGGWDVQIARVEKAGVGFPAGGDTSGPAPGRASRIYYQRIAPGVAMSALFLADGRRSRLLGVNRQTVRPFGDRPFIFRGCIGPIGVAPAVQRTLGAMLDALTADFGLRGLNGLDFLLNGDEIRVIELNPRPPASVALYGKALPEGLLRAHVEASLYGRLDGIAPAAGSARPRGFETVFAKREWEIDAWASDALLQRTWCHDVPVAGTRIARGEPLCTVSAVGDNPAEVEAQLRRRRQQIPFVMEQFDERSSEGACERAHECQ
ncbi:MAG TPA: ATP-grasp domain-containing protein [Aromatoleum sp.]|uniref:ATP-grasp domain-containing protein n=1 Tax=Aromatoleum sp. TaxID=2307007 RepID=UPI002B4647B9|nr:ATP-grasp domain-containing protein [Aromatoleum sp.]HJV25860.1 ATP-grasp domain-containing protein [Aromatoleum sp.]